MTIQLPVTIRPCCIRLFFGSFLRIRAACFLLPEFLDACRIEEGSA
ncbi:hypothetical protein ABZZ20_30935 [Streptomyces sp. NPDC006430]